VYREYTSLHARGTARIAIRLARALEMSDGQIEHIRLAGIFHDIGHLGINSDILGKPGPLDEEEWRMIRMHPEMGAEMFAGLPGYERVVAGIRHHHERWDGGGYPEGLAGNDIPVEARIISVADAFQAMTSHRAYAPAMTTHAAVEALQADAGTARDPMLVALLCNELGHYEDLRAA